MATSSSALSGVTKFGCFTPDVLTQLLGGFSMGGLFSELAQDNITAAGSTQATAFQTTGQTIRVATAAAGTGILLPPSTSGLEVLVINHGANSLQVYGNNIDTIDDVATATGVTQMINSLVIYTCATGAIPGTAGKWYSEGLSTGFGQAGIQTMSFTDGITAHAGGGQGSAVPLTTVINRVSVAGAGGTDSVLLPVSKPGMVIVVMNGSANSMAVFPAGTEAINALGASTGFTVTTLVIAVFYCFTAGQWFTLSKAG